MPRLPERVCYSLKEIRKLWRVGENDLKQWLMHGQLNASIWMPLMSVYEIAEKTHDSKIVLTKNLRHWEGYAPVYSHHCRRIFKFGKVYLRDFICTENGRKLALPETADSICAVEKDLIILLDEKKRFEHEHHIDATTICNVKIIGRAGKSKPPVIEKFDPSFKQVSYNGQHHSFGDMQASVLQQLYEGAMGGEPWQNGKRLLEKAGSQSFTLSNIFKRNPLWRQLITSDERGSYKLSDSFLQTIKHHQPVTT